MDHKIHKNKAVSVDEFASLMQSVGWGNDYDRAAVRRSIAAYPFVAHARDNNGQLIGYVSAFSDGAFSTMLGELVVHPSSQGQGVGRSLLAVVEQEYRNIPIYVKPLGEAKMFFLACGYRLPTAEICVLFKKNEIPANSEVDADAHARRSIGR
jgi:GNAT superfamily N-acetyltransferase